MMKGLKIGLLVVLAFVVVTLLTLRATGLEPPYVDPSSEEFAKSGRTTRPGLWLTGEVVHEPVTNWDWVNKVNDPIRKNTIMLETRTWYGIPHSVTINIIGRGDKLYVQGSERDFRLKKSFPYSKAWWANVERDPRVHGRQLPWPVAPSDRRAAAGGAASKGPQGSRGNPGGAESHEIVVRTTCMSYRQTQMNTDGLQGHTAERYLCLSVCISG